MTTQNIDHRRFNQIRDKLLQVMGEGYGNFGYGQTNLLNKEAIEYSLVTAADLNALRSDIIRMRQHQLGQDRANLITTDPEYLKLVSGSGPVEDRDFVADVHFTNMNTAATNGITDRFNVASTEFTLETYVDTPNGPGTVGGIISVRNEVWSSQLNHSVRIQFRNGKEARYFFNAGGELIITPNISSGNGDNKYLSWERLLNTLVGSVKMGYNYTTNTGSGGGGQPNIGFYQLTTVPQVIYQKSSSPTYTQNIYKVSARVNSTNNNPESSGYNTDLASQITFDIEFNDLHTATVTQVTDPVTGVVYNVVNPDEPVTGRLASEVSQRRPTGSNVLVYGPSGYFNDTIIA